MSHPEVDLALKVRVAARHRENFLNLLAAPLVVPCLLVRLSASLEEPMVDDRSPTAKAMSIVSRITTISLLAILPIVIGSWLDGWLGYKPVLTLLGMVFGLTAAGFKMIRLVKKLEKDSSANRG